MTKSAPRPVAETPASQTQANPASKTKIASVVDLLRRPDGATLEMLMQATGWQAHSVRGAIAGAIKKGQGLEVASEKIEGIRVYRITPEVPA